MLEGRKVGIGMCASCSHDRWKGHCKSEAMMHFSARGNRLTLKSRLTSSLSLYRQTDRQADKPLGTLLV